MTKEQERELIVVDEMRQQADGQESLRFWNDVLSWLLDKVNHPLKKSA